MNEGTRHRIEDCEKIILPEKISTREEYDNAKELFEKKYPGYKMMHEIMDNNGKLFEKLVAESKKIFNHEEGVRLKDKVNKLYQHRKGELDDLTIRFRKIHDEMEEFKKKMSEFATLHHIERKKSKK